MKSDLSEDRFRTRLAELGLVLDDKAFAAAWKGARHLRSEVERVEAYLAK